MTRQPDGNRVSLSLSNWIGLITLVFVMIAAGFAAYLGHDRALAKLEGGQLMIEGRLVKIESKIESKTSYERNGQ